MTRTQHQHLAPLIIDFLKDNFSGGFLFIIG
jgi:hypothetical protein